MYVWVSGGYLCLSLPSGECRGLLSALFWSFWCGNSFPSIFPPTEQRADNNLFDFSWDLLGSMNQLSISSHWYKLLYFFGVCYRVKGCWWVAVHFPIGCVSRSGNVVIVCVHVNPAHLACMSVYMLSQVSFNAVMVILPPSGKQLWTQSGVCNNTLPPALNLPGQGLLERTVSQMIPRGPHCIFRSSWTASSEHSTSYNRQHTVTAGPNSNTFCERQHQ